MSFLLDTNVVSETMRKQPSPAVLDWIARQIEEAIFISVITLGELRRGALLLSQGKKRRALLHWIDIDIQSAFGERILPVDIAVMECWAELQATSEKAGRRLPVMDSLISATALAHNLTLTTRDIADFRSTKVSVINPWQPDL